MARLFLEVLRHYRLQKKYLPHEFVVMPDHFHLLITPTETLERAPAADQRRLLFQSQEGIGLREGNLADELLGSDGFDLDDIPQRLKPVDVSAGIAALEALRHPKAVFSLVLDDSLRG